MKKTFAAIAACMVACAAQAGGFYVGGQLGVMTSKNLTDSAGSSVQQNLGGTVTSSQDTQAAAGRIFAGYNINPLVGIELGYLQMSDVKGSVAGTTAGNSNYSGDFTYRTSGFDVSAVVHPFESSASKETPPTGLYLRAGISEYTLSGSSSSPASSFVSWRVNSLSGTGTILGLGYDWKLGPGALRLDATLHQSMANVTDNDSLALSVGYLYAF